MVRDDAASERQVAFLYELARERLAPTDAIARLQDALAHGRMTKAKASESISWLLRQPVKPGVVPSRIRAFPKREHNFDAEIQEREAAEEAHRMQFKYHRDRIDEALTPPKPRPNGDTPAPLGVYVKDGEIYVVKSNRTGDRRYAVRLVVSPPRITENGEEVDFSYVRAPGMVYALTEADRMPEADMKDFMLKYRKCIRCGHGLKAAKTLKRSEQLGVMVGKTCARKMGLIR